MAGGICHDDGVSSRIIARYDRHARAYDDHWAPVIAPAAVRVLDLVAPWLPGDGAGRTLLDVGAGTGTLGRAAARRWPSVEIIALDPSSEMLALAAHRLRADGAGDARMVVAPADAMPLPEASVDVVVSSFALQLVPDRPAALREIRRVLRSDGRLAYVTWLDRGEPFAPHEAFDEAVLDLDIDEPDEPEDDRAGDLASAGAATAQLRRAGFVSCGARTVGLRHTWTPESFLAYKLECDESALMDWLSRGERARLERYARRRLAALPAEAYVWGTEVVVAWACVPSAETRIASAAAMKPRAAAERKTSE